MVSPLTWDIPNEKITKNYCILINGLLYRVYYANENESIPNDFIPIKFVENDEVITDPLFYWKPLKSYDEEDSEGKNFIIAYLNYVKNFNDSKDLEFDGVFEAVGPNFPESSIPISINILRRVFFPLRRR